LVHVIDESFQSIPELAIPADIPVEACSHRLVAGVREVQEEMTKVQLELSLQITKLQFEVHPSTPPKVRE